MEPWENVHQLAGASFIGKTVVQYDPPYGFLSIVSSVKQELRNGSASLFHGYR